MAGRGRIASARELALHPRGDVVRRLLTIIASARHAGSVSAALAASTITPRFLAIWFGGS